jgi:hypothetical protein
MNLLRQGVRDVRQLGLTELRQPVRRNSGSESSVRLTEFGVLERGYAQSVRQVNSEPHPSAILQGQRHRQRMKECPKTV